MAPRHWFLPLVVGWSLLGAGFAAERPQSGEPASLRIEWTGELAGRKLTVSLIPIDTDSASGSSKLESIARSTQTVTAAATQWDALPHGTYVVVVHSGIPGLEGGVPTEVAEVMLGPGERRSIRASLPALVEVDTTPRGDIHVLVTGATDDLLRLSVWRGGRLIRLTPEIQRTEEGFLLIAHAACGSEDVLVVESGSRVGVTEEGSTCGETLRVALLGWTPIGAQIEVPNGVEPPRSAILESTSCTDGKAIAVPFEVNARRVQLPAIAGCKGATLHAPGFAPVRLPVAAVNAKGVRDAGSITLVPGGAVAFRVRSRSDREPVTAAQVSAIRASDLARTHDLTAVESLAIATTRTDPAGWVRLVSPSRNHSRERWS